MLLRLSSIVDTYYVVVRGSLTPQTSTTTLSQELTHAGIFIVFHKPLSILVLTVRTVPKHILINGSVTHDITVPYRLHTEKPADYWHTSTVVVRCVGRSGGFLCYLTLTHSKNPEDRLLVYGTNQNRSNRYSRLVIVFGGLIVCQNTIFLLVANRIITN